MKKSILILAVLALAFSASAQKKVSVLGDSYSTFRGSIPDKYDTWYPNNSKEVKSPEQMWWHLFVEANGYVLEKNDSWSGTTICNTGYDGKDYSHSTFFTRVNMLGDPDIIFVFGGTNDAWAKSPLGEYKYRNWTRKDLYSYRPALAYLLSQLKMFYPEADIYFMLNSELYDEFNESTFEVCKKYKIPVIALHDIEKEWAHPSVKGMQAISDQLTEFIRNDIGRLTR